MKFFKALFKFFLVVGIFAVLGKIFLFDVVKTDSFNMVPNLMPGDVVLVSRHAALEHGDIAVCTDPLDNTRLLALRVMAMDGETIAFDRNSPVVDGKKLQRETGRGGVYSDTSTVEEFEFEVTISPEENGGKTYNVAVARGFRGRSMRERKVSIGLFLVGDNRNHAYDSDSRKFGAVDAETCLGQAVLVLWAGDDSGDLLADDRWLARL